MVRGRHESVQECASHLLFRPAFGEEDRVFQVVRMQKQEAQAQQSFPFPSETYF